LDWNLPRKKSARVRRSNPLGAAVFLLCFVVLVSSVWSAKNGTWAVSVDGQPVARVFCFEDVQQALSSLHVQYGEAEVEAARTRVKVAQVGVDGDIPLVGPDELEHRLAEALGLAQNATALYIDGKKQFVFADRATALRFLERVKKSYTVEDGAEAKFLEEIRLAAVKVHRDEVIDLERAVRLAREDIENVTEYKIREGDTLWDIARMHDLTVDALLASNPGLQENAVLRIGEPLVIAREKPLLTVVTTAHVVENREIPYQTVVRRDPNMPAGQRKVLEPGRPGQEEVTYLVIRQNGRLVAKERLEAREIKAPVTRVEVSGSKIVLASRAGSGQLAWPVRGTVVSPFGMRYGRLHSGIDIAAGTGTPVVAAEGGRVIRCGWHGGYGICIDISHGGGVVTRYAHLSRTAVSVGREVQRGQRIGAVGSTGNSTGPHLHFEVIINGQPQNPLNYL
jgi:murein DD-endopeptidase MepM/ murein hydrolase activator NlpD